MKFRHAPGILSRLFLSLAIIGSAVVAHAQTPEPPQQTVGLFFNDGAVPGYNLFTSNRSTGAYLVDNDGQLINSWIDPDGYSPGSATYLTERGTLLKSCFVDEEYQIGGPGAGRGGMIREYAWESGEDGKAVVIWQYRFNTENFSQHHDFQLLPSGNLLLTSWEKDPVLGVNWERLVEIVPDYVNWDSSPCPAHGVGGKIVWEWRQLDYLVPSGADPADHPDLWDPSLPPPRINAVHYDAQKEHLLISANNEIWIINRGNQVSRYFIRYISRYLRYFYPWLDVDQFLRSRFGITDGIMYRWGAPATYLGSGVQSSFFQHGVNWIKRKTDEGYRLRRSEGVGNILFYNNRFPGGSVVQEFTPPYKASARTYVQPAPGEAFGPETARSIYTPVVGSMFLGSAQRLPGGNTLICSGVPGTFEEVAPNGTVVWKYISPVSNISPVAPKTKIFDDVILGKFDPIPLVGLPTNAPFRVRRYAPRYKGFRGKDLSPQGELIGATEP